MMLLLIVSIASGIYAFAEGRGRSKSVSWTVFVISLVGMAAILLVHYFRFVLAELPTLIGVAAFHACQRQDDKGR